MHWYLAAEVQDINVVLHSNLKSYKLKQTDFFQPYDHIKASSFGIKQHIENIQKYTPYIERQIKIEADITYTVLILYKDLTSTISY